MTPSLEKPSSRPAMPLLIVAAAFVLVGGIVWYISRTAGRGEEAIILTPEAKEYTKNLRLSEVDMKATDNVLGQTLVEITGKITNAGDRPVQNVVLTCVFYDPYGQVVARELVPIVRSRDGVLSPGEARKFRLPFDALPDEWNQTMPQLVIAQIVFE